MIQQLIETLSSNLNTNLWDGFALKPEVRGRLLEIADDFVTKIKGKIQFDPVDIIFTGSNANYNYTPTSDIDVHIVGDFEPGNGLYALLHDEAKLWNTKHNINIKRYKVELYVQDYNSPLYAGAVYSLLYNVWIRKPKVMGDSMDNTFKIDDRFNELVKEIDLIEAEKDQIEALRKIESLIKQIKEMRKSGLSSGGENSVGNLVFKKLRNEGQLARLMNLGLNLYDQNFDLD